MSALPPNSVHKGMWINHSSGPTLGATFTTGSGTGNVIIALLSILLGFTGSHLWDLLAFAVYLLRSTSSPANGLHHQHQSILRNAGSPGVYALQSMTAIWHWRHKVHHAWKQFVFPIAAALFCSWGFLAAGIFASQVVQTSDIMVLASSNRCAYLASQTADAHYETSDKVNQLWSQSSALHVTNALYAQNCYNTSEKLSQCNVYPVQYLPVATRLVPCPFGDFCYQTNGTALMQESNLVDSHLDLGINSRPENRVQWQQRLTCAPLDSNQFLTTLNATEEDPMFHEDHPALPGEIAYHYALGPSLTAYRQGNVSWRLDNYTVNLGTSYTDGILTHDSTNLNLNNWNSTVPALNKTDATIVLIYIASNGMRNAFPVDDPVFAAHRPTLMEWNGANTTVYLPDNPMGLIACQEDHRFCVSGSRCTPYSGRSKAARAIPLMANPVQNATLRWLFHSIPGLNVFSAGSNVPQLRATGTVESRVQWAPLPPNQWEIEMRNLWPLRAAWTQSMPLLMALGASTLQSGTYEQPVTPITDPLERALCGTVKMQAPPGFVNVNIFGLAFIIGLSGVIILTNLILTPSLRLMAYHCNTGRLRRWIQDGALHVLRKAYEGVGHGDWERTWSEVPSTFNGAVEMVTLADHQTLTDYVHHLDTKLGKTAASLASVETSCQSQLVLPPGKRTPSDQHSLRSFKDTRSPRASFHGPARPVEEQVRPPSVATSRTYTVTSVAPSTAQSTKSAHQT